MFNELSIVTTAISSFNNAALFGPYFLATALLSVPLFYFIYVYGHDILVRMKCKNNTEDKIAFFSVAFLVLWLLIFGGNYAVIRDGVSLLSLVISFVLFISVSFVTKCAIKLDYLSVFKNKKIAWLCLFILLLFGAISAPWNLYSILLQLSAILCGIIVGSRLHTNGSNIVISTLIFATVTTLVLMQPEYFRFGQLGNLTVFHLVWLLLTGFFAITTLVLKYTNARAKIYNSAFIKLKWLLRIVLALALVLFIVTESLPVFVGLLVALGLLEMLTVYHSKQKNEYIFKQSWALLLFCFGVLIICPVISCLGIIYFADLSKKTKAKDFIDLL